MAGFYGADAVQASGTEKEVVFLTNGTPVKLASTGKVLGSFALDAAVLAVLSVAAYFVVERNSLSGSQPVLAAIGAWIGGSAVYGMLCFTGRTLGCLVVLIVIWIFGIVASGGAGTSGSASKNPRIYHRHIDRAATRRLRQGF